MALRMPAEWASHEATWLAWPHEKSDWPGKFAPIPWLYADIVRHLAQVERVRIVVSDLDAQESVRKILVKNHVEMNAIDFIIAPTDRSWVRDTMAIFVHNGRGQVEATDWRFNAWAKYDNFASDDALPSVASSVFGFKHHEAVWKKRRVVLEGGSIEVNGEGLMLTTEECLLSPIQARNPELSREDIEAVFSKYLGINRTLWLKNGIAGDDTHGHVDDLARFTDASTILIANEPDRSDANHEPLAENLALLRRVAKDLRIIPLPMPEPIWFANQRLPASYANFYIANGIVLVPVFNDPNDRLALNAIAKALPAHKVIPIYCRDLVLGLGTLHCMTQQEPRRIKK
jgi:agmatine deiminase